jgi:hypothetical protein
VVDEVVGYGGVEDGGGVELFAGDGGADDGEDAGADDSADAEGGERDGTEGFAEGVLRFTGLRDQLVNGLPGEELTGQGVGSSNGIASRTIGDKRTIVPAWRGDNAGPRAGGLRAGCGTD